MQLTFAVPPCHVYLQGCAYAVSMPGGSTSVSTYSASSSTDADYYYRDSYTLENSETSPEETGSAPEEGGTETAEVCSNGDCDQWSLADLADYALSAYIFDSYIGGRVGE